ncbi:MAG: Xaa-Pro aminopeptidase, partial [Planctomycetota bacterium]
HNDFPGRPLGADPELAIRSGLTDQRSSSGFAQQLEDWEQQERLIRLPLREMESHPSEAGWIHPRTPLESLALHLSSQHPGLALQSGFADIAALRSVKSPAEVEVIRAACAITCSAIQHAAGFVRAGITERDLEAELEAAFKRGGAQRLAFDSIIKSGPNSLWPWRILAAQYDRRNRSMHAGELVIFDVGCELDHYASDIGRTFPVSGRFSAQQRARLEMVISVSDAIMAAIRPGVTLAELQQVAVAATPENERQHMQTGLFFGHPIGLDVGDAMPDDFELQPGTIFTIEPWYYNHQIDLAVFVEDNVLVTAEGCENLTARLPRSPSDLERMVGRAYE